MDLSEKLDLCENKFTTQKHMKTCLVCAVYNNLVYLADLNDNPNFKEKKKVIKKWGYGEKAKNPKGHRKTIYDKFRAEINLVRSAVVDKLDKLNYELEYSYGKNIYQTMIDINDHSEHSLPIVDLAQTPFFDEIYGVEASTNTGHAVNVIHAEREKTLIFDPYYDIITGQKNIDEEEIEENLYEKHDAVLEISQNLFTDWWGSTRRPYWTWIFKSLETKQPSLFEFDNKKERAEHEIRKFEARY